MYLFAFKRGPICYNMCPLFQDMSHDCPSQLFCPKTCKKLLAMSNLNKMNPTNPTLGFWTWDPNRPNLTHKFGQKYSLPKLEEKVPDYVRIWCIFSAFWRGPTWYNMCPSFRDMSHDCSSPLFSPKTCKKLLSMSNLTKMNQTNRTLGFWTWDPNRPKADP